MNINDKQNAVISWLMDDDRFNSISSFSKAKLDEAIRLGSSGRETTNDRSGTDYSKAFVTVHNNIDRVEKLVEKIYQENKVAESEQIFANIIPLIEGILDKYVVELEELEKAHVNAIIPVIANNIASAINGWVMQLSRLESMVNQNHELQLKGNEVVSRFTDKVYKPMTDYTGMISKLATQGKAQVDEKGIRVKFENIMREINKTSSDFFESIFNEGKSQIGQGTAKKGLSRQTVPSNP